MHLDDNEISIFGARRADVAGFGARVPHGEGLALLKSVESGNLSLNKVGIRWIVVYLTFAKTLRARRLAITITEFNDGGISAQLFPGAGRTQAESAAMNLAKHRFPGGRNPLSSRASYFLFRNYYKYRHKEIYQRLMALREAPLSGDFSLRQFSLKECLFVHIPKCAGASIAKTLFGNLAGGHCTIRDYQIAFAYDEFHRYFKFSFVRNPWDRLVSAFYYLKNMSYYQDDRDWATQNLSGFDDFNSFVRKWVNPSNIMLYPHFRPQIYYVRSVWGDVPLDFIGRFENLREDFSCVSTRLGVEVDLQVHNTGEGHKYLDEYDDVSRRIVSSVYDEDISYFGYRFDNS